MLHVGFVGWRGMVGSVLLSRIIECNDLLKYRPIFFSCSQAGGLGPVMGDTQYHLQDAFSVNALSDLDVIVSCQGNAYTKAMHGKLRNAGWKGFWIDAASHLRMKNSSVIVLDPINRSDIMHAIQAGVKDFIGGNCTVSLMLLAIHGLIHTDVVEWVNVSTYQAISGAGAEALKAFIMQCAEQGLKIKNNINLSDSIIDIERSLHKITMQELYSTAQIGKQFCFNMLPWIDQKQATGQTREEWKGSAETAKILGAQHAILIDGLCVRVPSLRCHAQSLAISLKRKLELQEITKIISEANDWVRVIENEEADTLEKLTPMAVSGSLAIHVGRIKQSLINDRMINLFTVGDQLLWGAAEPLRRALMMIVEQRSHRAAS